MDKTRKTSKRRPRRSFTPEFKAEVTCPPKADPSAMRVPTGPGWALETLDETDTTHP
jgi:hypothetical protein